MKLNLLKAHHMEGAKVFLFLKCVHNTDQESLAENLKAFRNQLPDEDEDEFPETLKRLKAFFEDFPFAEDIDIHDFLDEYRPIIEIDGWVPKADIIAKFSED